MGSGVGIAMGTDLGAALIADIVTLWVPPLALQPSWPRAPINALLSFPCTCRCMW